MFDKKKDRFSIRKFKVGLGSIFLGSFLLTTPILYTNIAKAEDVNKPAQLEEKQAEKDKKTAITLKNIIKSTILKIKIFFYHILSSTYLTNIP